jgi:hypothetical protein
VTKSGSGGRIGRRALLGGAAVTVALPFLPSLEKPTSGVRLAKAAATAPKRFLVYYIPNGVYAQAWTPTATGTDYPLSETLMPLAPVKDDVLLLTGLTNRPGVPPTTGGAHAEGSGAMLTCRQYMKDNVINLGKSVDQVIADSIGMATKLPSLELGITDRPSLDGPNILGANIAWKGPSTPAPPIEKPSVAFDRLTMGFDPGASQTDAARRRAYRTSVLDAVYQDANRLHPRLATHDQAKLDEFMTSLRDVESQIQNDPAVGGSCMIPARPTDPTDFPTQVDVNHKLISLAFQCDITRVVTFMHGYALGGRPFPFIGVPDNGHSVTHHSGDPALIAKEKLIDAWRIGQLVTFIQMLKAIPDVDGNSVLHNTCIYYTSEIDDGNSHNQDNKPVLIAGQLGGAFKTGQHIEFPAGAHGMFKPCDERSTTGCMQPQIADLYLTIMKEFGINMTTFGDSGTGTFTNLGS